ncbi:type II and III secretion system protein family protein [Peteryoungia algae]|uniref:Type II and III secretion system protein family protein n=1 Tax=Peteryoungia algae TaxID=2919917 RepID=A0ABT0CUP8_9HYPH|nr:type II and III secretion system protein family protein [Rhizobium sp. SSM4.3]MCJ8236889.1 type II and III secretion system protein family protein [Rhizobium sp. SSM4.3]
MTFTGSPASFPPHGSLFPAAEAAQQTVLRITNAGPGARRTVKLGLNKALVVDLPADAHDILVADPAMADAVTRSSRRIYLFGKTVGQTNIFIFGADGNEIISLDIEIERDIAGLEANLRRFIPQSDIKVEIVSDNIVLTGTVRTPQDAARAQSLAQAFLKGGEATTRNQTASGGDNGGDVAIYAEDRQESQIVNLLTIEGEDQVTLKVTVAEVSRQVLKQLGFSGSVSDGSTGISYANPSNLGNAIDPTGTATISAGIGGLGINTYINAMEQAGVMRTLAEPSLTAISGEAAKFYVGGEFRIAGQQEVTSDEEGTSLERTTETVDYGIELNFRPVVLAPGRISLQIETNVSEPTWESSQVTGNILNQVPGSTYLSIRKREASTTVELPSGGSIVIAGLVQDNIRQATSGLPGLSKVPVLGTLFRSKDFQRNETELVIIATPYLVRPVARGALSRPDDNFNPENDGATFFLNKVNKVYGRRENPVAPGQYHGAVGFIYK